MAVAVGIILFTVTGALCRPSDFSSQELNDWNAFNELSGFAKSENKEWRNNAIGNDIGDLFNSNNNIAKEQGLDSTLSQDPSNEGDRLFNETVLDDPCYGVRCRKGKMCIVANENTNETACVCPTQCPSDHAPVCTTMGVQYNNTCHAHKEHCRLEKDVEIAYAEACIAKQGPCLEGDLSQFPIRFLEWMMHVRQAEMLGETDPNSSVRRLTDAERFSVSKWMFQRVDLEHDKSLQSYDMKYLLRQLLPVEHCIDEFLQACDVDKSGDLSMMEWNNCLMPGTNSVENDFFDSL